MTGENRNILNRIFRNWPKGTVGTLAWFRDHGGYQQLLDYYQKAPWVTKIGSGAYIQYGDIVDWRGGLYAVQNQLNLSVCFQFQELKIYQPSSGRLKIY